MTAATGHTISQTVRVIDVVVPLYRGHAETQACIESVLANAQHVQFELIIIDDASPEPELSRWASQLAARGQCTLLKNDTNLGFVRTASRGMDLHRDRDVVLLNSDTVVANDWLDRLRNCAYSDARIATVTPFSNNAEICSYPRFCAVNPLLPRAELEKLDALFSVANCGCNVELPTGVGFCFYLKRDALNDIGTFDAATFGAGYGEENDFCQRAIQRGWKNVIAADVYVGHAGGVSFGAGQAARKAHALASLLKLHPGYSQDVGNFIAADPAKVFRTVVDFCRLATGAVPIVLAVVHARGGGTQKHIDDLARLMQGKAHCLILRPLPADWVELGWSEPGEALKLQFDLQAARPLLLETLELLAVDRVHYHSLLELPHALRNIAADLKVPYDFTWHDYFTICPQIHLNYGGGARYCEEREAQCQSCLKQSSATRNLDIEAWRAVNRRFLERAARVFAPSQDVARRITRYLPQLPVTLAPHPETAKQAPIPRRRRQLEQHVCLRIAVIGAISTIKGADLLEACALDAVQRKLPLDYQLIGFAYRELTQWPHAALAVQGSYDDHELSALIEASATDVVWIPALVPETYSYTLSAAIQSGLPVVVPDLGALGGRIAQRPWSWCHDWRFSARQMNDWLLKLREQYFVASSPPAFQGELAQTDAPVFSYERDYMATVNRSLHHRIEHALVAQLAGQICRQEKHAEPKPGFVADRVFSLLRAIKQHQVLSKMVKRVPEHHQQRIRRLLLNTRRRSRA